MVPRLRDGGLFIWKHNPQSTRRLTV